MFDTITISIGIWYWTATEIGLARNVGIPQETRASARNIRKPEKSKRQSITDPEYAL